MSEAKARRGKRATGRHAKLGRPRADGSFSGGDDPREEILEAGARLFASLGYRQTTTKQIAEAVGLRQASLFYYFPKKEDMLAALLHRTVRTQLRFADELTRTDAGPAVRLCALIYSDIRTLSEPPGNLGWLVLQPEARSSRHAEYHTQYARLQDTYRSLIEAGRADGSLLVDDVEMTTRIVCGVVDGVATWYDASRGEVTSEEIWDAVTDHTMRAILTDPERLPEIRASARAVHDEIASRDPEAEGSVGSVA